MPESSMKVLDSLLDNDLRGAPDAESEITSAHCACQRREHMERKELADNLYRINRGRQVREYLN